MLSTTPEKQMWDGSVLTASILTFALAKVVTE